MGIEAAVTFDDPIITAYRNHCQAYLRGVSLFEIFTEMLGKQGGASKGKGGSMHYYNTKTNYYGGNGIVGAQ
jgi:pyruvate dehydrogenase E1 component alpha subunit